MPRAPLTTLAAACVPVCLLLLLPCPSTSGTPVYPLRVYPTEPQASQFEFVPRVSSVDALTDSRVSPEWWRGERPSQQAGGVFTEGDVVYIFVRFDRAVHKPAGGAPTLALRTGGHFEPAAGGAVATFVGGGYGESKQFWANNEASPLKSNAAVPCRAAALDDANGFGDDACVFGDEFSGSSSRVGGTALNTRVEQAMDATLMFEYVVGSSGLDERAFQLATDGRDALSMNGSTLLAADVSDGSSGPAADLTLPPPASPQALKRRSHVTIGAPYVTRVRAVPAAAPRRGAGASYTTGDVIDIVVRFSEPVAISGCSWVDWRQQYAFGAGDRSCLSAYLLIETGSDTLNSTAGEHGADVFPTAFLVHDAAAREALPAIAERFGHDLGEPGSANETQAIADELAFRYVVRRGDIVGELSAALDQDSLVLEGDTQITRADRTRLGALRVAAAGTPAGMRLPPAGAHESLTGQPGVIAIDALDTIL